MGNSASLAAADEALYHAAAYGDEQALAELIDEKQANVNHIMLDENKATPTIAAAQEGQVRCLARLLETPHCEFERADKWGLAPVHYAARAGHADCLTALLAAGADAAAAARDGATPAHLAAERDEVGCLALLLQHGWRNVSMRTRAGKTPLETAIENGSDRCVRLLQEEFSAAAAADADDAGNDVPQSVAEHERLIADRGAV